MMFFIPFADTEGAAEEVYRRVARRCFEFTGIAMSPERVFALRYRFRNSEYLAQVGIEHPPGSGEPVICILESVPGYFICTLSHGVSHGEPLVIPRALVSDVEHFNNVRDEIA
jgi:hypothetical protein